MKDHAHHHAADSHSTENIWESIQAYFSQIDFMPHGHCYLWKPGLVWTHVISDILIGLAYVSISITLYLLVKKIRMPFHAVIVAFGIFIGACGATHFMEAWNLWHADYWISAWIKVITAIASVVTGIWLVKLHDPILMVAQAAKLAEERRLDLEALTRNLENRVEERTRELSAAVEARDQFLSVASHELKTPLTTMKLQNQLRSKKFSEGTIGEDMPKYFKSMDDQITRLTNLVDDMLDISHIQRGEFKLYLGEYDVCELVNEVVEYMKPRIRSKGGDIKVQLCESTLVTLDKGRIVQVIDNLLTNAFKYAPGTLVNLNVIIDEFKIRINVSDEGPGIGPAFTSKIFGKFERAISANEVSGLGLGLFISKSIVNAHGGTIWVESGQGKGAEFIFELPR